MGVFTALGAQLGNPHGLFGRLVAGGMVRGNARINAWAVGLLDPRPDDEVLEIGSGPGATLAQLADRVVYGRAVGVDRSAAMVRAARKRNLDEVMVGRADVREASVDALPFRDASFDRAVSIHSIYFWPDARRGLAEIRRVLRPGGRLVVAITPADEMRKVPVTRKGFTLFDDEALRSAFADAGFVHVRIESLARTRWLMPGLAAIAVTPSRPPS